MSAYGNDNYCEFFGFLNVLFIIVFIISYAGTMQAGRKRKAEDDEEPEERNKLTSKEVRPGLFSQRASSVWVDTTDGCVHDCLKDGKKEFLLFLKPKHFHLSYLSVFLLPRLSAEAKDRPFPKDEKGWGAIL